MNIPSTFMMTNTADMTFGRKTLLVKPTTKQPMLPFIYVSAVTKQTLVQMQMIIYHFLSKLIVLQGKSLIFMPVF